MANKLSPKVISFSLAGVSVIISLACALLIALIPKLSVKFFGSIFHGIDISKIETSITFSGFLMGLVAIIIISLIAGWLFAVIYNYFLNKEK